MHDVPESYCDKIDKLYTDVYVGDGQNNPSVTTRLFSLEENLESLQKNISKLIWLVVATLAGVVGELIMKGLGK